MIFLQVLKKLNTSHNAFKMARSFCKKTSIICLLVAFELDLLEFLFKTQKEKKKKKKKKKLTKCLISNFIILTNAFFNVQQKQILKAY